MDRARTNLPRSLGRFIGRGQEIAEVGDLIVRTPLVTLVGAGGVGKTRLALEVAAHLVDAYPDGVWLVELADVADPGLVSPTIAGVLGVRSRSDERLAVTLAERFSSPVLLVVDNCEHLVDAVAQVVEQLLRRCPLLSVLATSRQPLGLGGETTWRVPSLSLPSRTGGGTVREIGASEAVQLFVERARQVRPDFVLDDSNAQAVADLCHRLDGIPLALELSASRLRVLGLDELRAKLHDRFHVLTGGSRTALRRQQTLRGTVDWSYALLTQSEQGLLRRVAVFRGGATLEAIEHVCGGDELGEVGLDLVSQLVDKSLLGVEPLDGPTRYRLPETIREYALEKLLGSGEADPLRARHRDWYLAWVAQALPELTGPQQTAWYTQLEAEHDNVRAALEWSCADANGAEAELRLAAALGRFWHIRGYGDEGRRWLAHALARARPEPTVTRALALNWLGRIETTAGEPTRGRARLEQSAAMARAAGAPQVAALALRHLAMALAWGHGEDAQARTVLEKAIGCAEQAGDTREAAFAFGQLADIAERTGDYPAARAFAERALALGRPTGDAGPVCLAFGTLAQVALDQDSLALAGTLFTETLTAARSIQFVTGVLVGLHGLGDVARRQGQAEAAWAHYCAALQVARDAGDEPMLAATLAKCAGLAADAGDLAAAARMFGTVQGWQAESPDASLDRALSPTFRAEYVRDIEAARRGLGEPAFGASVQAGAQLSLRQGAASMLASAPRTGPDQTRAANTSVLSPREQEVVRLVARGLSNRQIAEQLIVSPRTAEAHVSHALSKLGLESRGQLIAWALAQQDGGGH